MKTPFSMFMARVESPGESGYTLRLREGEMGRTNHDKERTDMVKKDTARESEAARAAESEEKASSRHKAIDAALSQIEKQFG